MAERDVRERDILVAPNEYAYVQDLTKGNIILYVGPTKISLSNTERMILFRDGRFVPVRGEEEGWGVLPFVEATSSQYILLENPTEELGLTPTVGASSAVPLRHGRKVVVPGPARFPLWPGQTAEAVDGHRLRQDEYLVVRVYDDTFSDALPPIGTERIVRGMEHSFYVPESGMMVVPEHGSYVRKARRLDRKRGLHLRVVANFEAGEEDALPSGRYEAGQDLFLRDREGFFFPTEDLEVVGLVDAIPLAEDQGIYVRELDAGTVRIVEGPTSFLLDPTREEIVERDIDPCTAKLYGTKPGKYAPSFEVPPSTAVMLVSKNRREVISGPRTHVLRFDEDLEVLRLSTGRPKSDAELLETCFLRTEGNKVSDIVVVETSDHVSLEILLSYRVSFVGDAQRWFNVEDYVALLCDHAASIIRAAARASTVESFHADGTRIVRDSVLGPRDEHGVRVGMRFEENGMWVHDVEVLAVGILDAEVAGLLSEAQRMAIVSEVDRRKEELRLGDERLRESVSRALLEERVATFDKRVGVEHGRRELELAQVHTRLELDRLDQTERAKHEAEAFALRSGARLAARAATAELEGRSLDARASAFAREMAAVSPELIATLRTLGNQRMAGELSKSLSPLAILGGESVADIAERLLDRLPLALGDPGDGHFGRFLAAVEESDEAAAED